MVHKNGVEVKCDATLVGRYVTVEINMQKESGNSYEFEICSFAVLGECIGECEAEPASEASEARCPLADLELVPPVQTETIDLADSATPLFITLPELQGFDFAECGDLKYTMVS